MRPKADALNGAAHADLFGDGCIGNERVGNERVGNWHVADGHVGVGPGREACGHGQPPASASGHISTRLLPESATSSVFRPSIATL